jgi:hypothetical protein
MELLPILTGAVNETITDEDVAPLAVTFVGAPGVLGINFPKNIPAVNFIPPSNFIIFP